MNKLKEKLGTKSFWVSVSGALALLLSHLGVFDAAALADSVVQVVGGVLLGLGILAAPPAVKTQDDDGEKPEK